MTPESIHSIAVEDDAATTAAVRSSIREDDDFSTDDTNQEDAEYAQHTQYTTNPALRRHWTSVDITRVDNRDQITDVFKNTNALLHRGSELDSEATDVPPSNHLRKTCVRIRRWQFWVFDVLPVLLAIGISIEVFYLAQQREIAQARDEFYFTAKIAHTNLKMTLHKSIESARLLLGALLANSKDKFPEESVFENMVFSNPFFNVDKTIAKVILLDVVTNASRGVWQKDIFVLPDMMAAWGGQPKITAPNSLSYLPAHYVSPPQPEIIGLDFNADPINSQYIKIVRGIGEDAVTHMFQLRSGIPGIPEPISFRNGVVYHMPIFQSMTPDNGVFTSMQTDVIKGDLLFVFWMTGVLDITIEPLQIEHTDVFLFDITDIDVPSYIAHYESPENETRPFYTLSNITTVTPFNLENDFVTDWSRKYDIMVAQRRYRLLMRGRKGYYATRFSTSLPYILLGLSLAVKALDKIMHAIHHSKWCQ